MDRFYFSSSPWGFRFFELPDYCRTLKEIGIDRLSLMVGAADGFPQALKGGSKNASLFRDTFASSGVSALETAMLLDGDDDDIKLIADIGSKYLRICEVWEHTPESFKAVSDKLRSLGRKAADRGLEVIVENHGGLMATSEDCLKLFEKVGLDNVKLNYDAANFIHYGGEDPVSAWKAVREITGFTHLKSVSEIGFHQGVFCRIKEGVLDYKAIMQEIINSDYSGCLCLEYEKPEDVISGTSDDLASLKALIS
ncbi:MAG: sugar phosphate isomerase/epimerase [Lentisphaerae bacterium]|nr:sugar phosphate isomerase/epimerase [Lentisphaerota bacterium]